MNIFTSLRPSEKLAALITIIIILLSGIGLYRSAKAHYGVLTPIKGGTIKEGTVGYARFINPLLAFTDTDKDLVSLVYSGLLKTSPDGTLENDLAESWSISEDGLTYTVKLKPNAVFHDGKPVTTDDVEYTIQKAVDPAVKSVKAGNWSGVTIEKVSPLEIRFTLKKPYAPFAENLTLGILPKHIWESVASEAFDVSIFNKEPIGSGPYRITSATQDGSGLYTKYDLEPFNRYTLGAPLIERISFLSFNNEESAVKALLVGDIDTLGGISPQTAQFIKNEAGDDVTFIESELPRVFALFFNQNSQQVFLNKEVRQALSTSVDRQVFIDSILLGYGTATDSPIPESMMNTATSASSTLATARQEEIASNNIQDAQRLRIQQATTTLEKAGWKKGIDGIYEKKSGDATQRLSFTITTSNSPELKASAEILKEIWTAIGADVRIDIYESSDLTQKVIRPRKYEALLFGQVIGRDLDLYPFWHSSQRNDPGLNIAMYANIKADRALESARSSSDIAKQESSRLDFIKEIKDDIPAIFLFSPNYIYAVRKDIGNIHINHMTEPSERFMNISKWFLKTSYHWK